MLRHIKCVKWENKVREYADNLTGVCSLSGRKNKSTRQAHKIVIVNEKKKKKAVQCLLMGSK